MSTFAEPTFDPADLVGPSLDGVWDEIAEPKGDDPYALTSNAQNQIALAYQASQRLRRALAAGSVPSEAVSEAQAMVERTAKLVERLLLSMRKLVNSTVQASSRLPLKGEDLTQAANSFILAAAGSYCPDRGMAFSSWAVGRMTSEFKAMNRYDSQSSLTDGEDVVARVAAGVRAEFIEGHGRQPSVPELGALLEKRFLEYGLDMLTDEQRRLTIQEQRMLVHKRMVRKGHRKALDNLPQLLTLLQHEASLETPIGSDTGTMVLGDVITRNDSVEEVQEEIYAEEGYQRVLAAGLGGHKPSEREMVLRYFELPESSRTYRSVAQEFDVQDVTVRRLVKTTQVRLTAPHAQFNHLADDVLTQFLPDMEPQLETSVASSIRRRNRTAQQSLEAALLEIVS